MASPGPPEHVGTAESTAQIAEPSVPTPRVDSEQFESATDAHAGRFAAGDVDALFEVYRETSPLVFTIARRALASEVAAEEATQSVYVRAWRARDTYDPTRRPLKAWLVGITRSVIADRIADRAGHTGFERAPGEVGRVEPASDDGIAERVADAIVVADGLSSLEQPRRQVVEMSFFEGLSHTQIAETLGIPVGTVKVHIKRGLAQLRRQLGASDAAS